MKIEKERPTTIDEILDLYGFNSDSLKASIEWLINQRVIDELETFIDHSGKYYGVDYAIKERIKELKQ